MQTCCQRLLREVKDEAHKLPLASQKMSSKWPKHAIKWMQCSKRGHSDAAVEVSGGRYFSTLYHVFIMSFKEPTFQKQTRIC